MLNTKTCVGESLSLTNWIIGLIDIFDSILNIRAFDKVCFWVYYAAGWA